MKYIYYIGAAVIPFWALTFDYSPDAKMYEMNNGKFEVHSRSYNYAGCGYDKFGIYENKSEAEDIYYGLLKSARDKKVKKRVY